MHRPLFWTITGSDFGRSIRWAKTQPRLRDMIPLPTHIGGYQHLEPWVRVKSDDILVDHGAPIGFCRHWAHETVGAAEYWNGCNVYRLMPVAKEIYAH